MLCELCCISMELFLFIYEFSQITQEDIDALSTQELRVQAHEEERVYPDIPMCIVSVFAEDDAAPHIQYSVKVEGIVEKKTVNIVRWLQRESKCIFNNYY